MIRPLVVLGIILAALPAAGSVTIISQSGTGTSGYGGTSYVSWTQTGSFSGVTIQADLFSLGGTATGSAYLVTQVGAGATAAQQIGSTVPISISATSPVTTTLFSNLTLAPGTYYLVISSASNLAWSWIGTPITVTAPGVTANNFAQASPVVTYAPASSWYNKSGQTLFSAVADVVATVPVLSPWVMLGVALLLGMSGLMLLKRYSQPARNL